VKITVFGATGRTGRELVSQALERGHEVVASARVPSRVSEKHPRLRVVQGDVLDRGAVEAAVAESEAVLSALGHSTLLKDTTFSDGVRNILAAMDAKAVRRLILVSSLGVGESKDQLGLFYNLFLIPVFLRNVFWDKESAEELVRESHLEWTIVRPGALTSGPRTGSYRVGFATTEVPTSPRISRADVAHFMLEELAAGQYLRRSPGLFY